MTKDQTLSDVERFKGQLSIALGRSEISESHRAYLSETMSRVEALAQLISAGEGETLPTSPAKNWFHFDSIGFIAVALAVILAAWAIVGGFVVGVFDFLFRLDLSALHSWGYLFFITIAGFFAFFSVRSDYSEALNKEQSEFKSRIDENERSIRVKFETIKHDFANWHNDQKKNLQELISSARTAEGCAKSAVQNIDKASGVLVAAKDQLDRKASVSFWEHIEQVANSLSLASESLVSGRAAINRYASFLSAYKGSEPIPLIGVSVHTMIEIGATAKEVAALMAQRAYEAQLDHNFAQIYEMRRNTSTLVEGFSTLRSAIMDMGSHIEKSIMHLDMSVSSQLADVSRAIEHLGDEMREANERAAQSPLEDRLVELREIAEEAVTIAAKDSRFSREAIIESLKSDYEIKTMLAEIGGEVVPKARSPVFNLYGQIFSSGPKIPR